MANIFPYEDIVGLQRPVSKKYPRASISDRAARFSPFAAITGYEEMVLEVARVTEEKIILSEDEKAVLNEKLRWLKDHVSEAPYVSITFFVPDEKKSGGKYVCVNGTVFQVDGQRRCVEYVGGERVPFEGIVDIEGDFAFDF